MHELYEDEPTSAKDKGCLLYFSPYTLLPTQALESFPDKTSLWPEQRLMSAILEEAVAQSCIAKRKGSNQYGYTILYFYHSRIYCGLASQPCLKHELNHLILFLIAGIDFK
jgi:hypothetical protein